MKEMLINYIKDEDAMETIEVVILTVLSLGAALAVGTWVWNLIVKQTKNCDPNSPFCTS